MDGALGQLLLLLALGSFEFLEEGEGREGGREDGAFRFLCLSFSFSCDQIMRFFLLSHAALLPSLPPSLPPSVRTSLRTSTIRAAMVEANLGWAGRAGRSSLGVPQSQACFRRSTCEENNKLMNK